MPFLLERLLDYIVGPDARLIVERTGSTMNRSSVDHWRGCVIASFIEVASGREKKENKCNFAMLFSQELLKI